MPSFQTQWNFCPHLPEVSCKEKCSELRRPREEMKRERKSPLRQSVNYHLWLNHHINSMHSSRLYWAAWEDWEGGQDWYLHAPIFPLGILQCSRKMQTRKAKSCAVLEYQKQLKVKHPSLICTRSRQTLYSNCGSISPSFFPWVQSVITTQRIMS